MLHALIPGVGPQEMIIIGIVGVLLFGKRLPEVGKSLGKGLAEFRKGMRGIEDELHSITHSNPTPASASSSTTASRSHAPPTSTNDLTPDPTVPKFEPPTSAPVVRDRAEAGSGYEAHEYHD